jgi:SAM-dependent methyltransferase
MSLKNKIKSVPVLGPQLVSVRRSIAARSFSGSSSYWESRYQTGGTSGPGSYGAVAQFKAETLNAFVREHGVHSVLEFGCGDGAQLSLAEYEAYVGLDVARSAIELCVSRFGDDKTKSFLFYDPAFFHNRGALRADLVLSLDVLLHLVEDEVLQKYLNDLSHAADRYIVIFAEDEQQAPRPPHIRNRNVAEWSPLLSGWQLAQRIDNPHKGAASLADFFVFERIWANARHGEQA